MPDKMSQAGLLCLTVKLSLVSSIATFKQRRHGTLFTLKKKHDFISKTANLVIPDNSLLITLGVERIYINIDHAEGLRTESKAL